MKIAILYQKNEPPVVDGIKKPMKKGGYSDSGADIAYCLRQNGTDVVLPSKNPDVYNDFDWVFPDTKEGIAEAIENGADTFWLNTVLYDNHPIESFSGIDIIGQRPSDVSKYDDKFFTNSLLRSNGLSVVCEQLVVSADDYTGSYPCIIKPVRGRGSQGVLKCDTPSQLHEALSTAIKSQKYGDKMIAEEFLCGNEITVAVLPKNLSLPVVERFSHVGGIAPYSGDVPVSQNSRVAVCEDENMTEIRKECEEAAGLLDLKGLVRIDCRADENGKYKIFDFNMKPNMTGSVRPNRKNQISLVAMAAESVGMSYYDLLLKLISYKWAI